MMNKQQLIEDNMNLVYHIIHRHYPTYAKDEDLQQVGMVGLCRAADTFDPEKSKFSTYACSCILNEIRIEFRNRSKHTNTLSLDYEVNDSDGERTSFGNICVGEEDIDIVDDEWFYEQLTLEQREIVRLREKGLTPTEISNELGVTKQHVNQTLRRLRILWRNHYGS